MLYTKDGLALFRVQGTGPENMQAIQVEAPDILSKPQKEGSESEQFWDLLGGKSEYPNQKVGRNVESDPQLFSCSFSTDLKVTERYNFNQDDLMTEDMFILDCHSDIFVWVGEQVNSKNRKDALTIGEMHGNSFQRKLAIVKNGGIPSLDGESREKGGERRERVVVRGVVIGRKENVEREVGYGSRLVREMSSERVHVELCKGINGLDKVVLREIRGSSAEVYLYGGHVTSWKNDYGEELLFVSSKAIFKPPKAIRGGIPICFPQFSNHGSLEQHGFARNRVWSIDTDPPPFPTNSSSNAFVDLILKPSEEDLKIFLHCFEFRLRVTLGPGGDLMLTSRIRNTNIDGKPFTFTFAYHTYFSVSDISEVRVEGLETLDYLDNMQNKERFTEQGDAITFESEVDKIYLSTPTNIAILDHEKKRTFVIRKDGLPDAVVWNPWDKKAKTMADFGDDEYKHMLCVEAAAVEKPITLKPGEEWRGRQELSTVPSSYCSGQLDPRRVLGS